MTSPYQTIAAGTGTRLQSAVPTRTPPADPSQSNGLLLRGVVMSTYTADDSEHPHAIDTNTGPVAVYCDVLCYSGIPGHRFIFIRGAIVSQERSGLHDGDIWKPKPTTKDLTGVAFDPDVGGNPYNLDGDHVLLGFLDNTFNQAIILRSLPHPQRDVGNSETDPARKLKLLQADGDPRFARHHGVTWGVTDNGNFLVDLGLANDGTTDDAGTAMPPTQDGSAGNYRIKLQEDAALTIEMDGGEVLTIKKKDGDAKLKLGDGIKSAVIAEAFQVFWDQFANTVFNAHIHQTPVGPTIGLPTPIAVTFPINAISTKVKIPDL